MLYRPEGWKNPYEDKVDEWVYFEAGADAMLEGLNSQEHQDWLATYDGEHCKGKWTFIPEE